MRLLPSVSPLYGRRWCKWMFVMGYGICNRASGAKGRRQTMIYMSCTFNWYPKCSRSWDMCKCRWQSVKKTNLITRMLKYRIVSCFTVKNLVLLCAIFSQLAERKGPNSRTSYHILFMIICRSHFKLVNYSRLTVLYKQRQEWNQPCVMKNSKDDAAGYRGTWDMSHLYGQTVWWNPFFCGLIRGWNHCFWSAALLKWRTRGG